MSTEGTGSMSPPAPEPSPWNLPNALTVGRILLVPVFVWLVLSDGGEDTGCLLYTSPSPRDKRQSRMPSSA